MWWGGYSTQYGQTVRSHYQIQLQGWDSVCLEDDVSMGKLAIMKCMDCGAIRHCIVPVDSIIECAACGSENVLYPYNPKY